MYDSILTKDVQYPSFLSKEAVLIIQKLLYRSPQLRLGAGERDVQEELGSEDGSREMLMEGDLVVSNTRNALNCRNKQCLWKKSSNGLVEVPYIMFFPSWEYWWQAGTFSCHIWLCLSWYHSA
ncbi:hypothetical protein AAFF_G00321180 [Aldrovandia affinis]|uniref:Uncharacterized protein n=1 Tax=Aldrovandia affinis TaxID=143900 RepID=A0AAD7SN58_9TELE|nr:hypothetical protein AAFF_G00321180 [Aldrovandia affinis]